MAVFNYSTRELTTKIVYYGPGLCGKTTNLQYVYDHMPQGVRGKMLSLATKSDRTLFFDFLPIDLGQIQGMNTKVQLYTVPGQVFYNETRRLVLKGADGVVFVADSQDNMIDANIDSFHNLEENLAAHGLTLAELPHVLQYNKQDLPNAASVEQLNEKLNKYNAPFYEAIATTGVGVQETLRHICKLVLIRLNERYGSDRSASSRASEPVEQAAPVAASVPAAAMATQAASPSPVGQEPLAPTQATEAPASAEPTIAAEAQPAFAPTEAAMPAAPVSFDNPAVEPSTGTSEPSSAPFDFGAPSEAASSNPVDIPPMPGMPQTLQPSDPAAGEPEFNLQQEMGVESVLEPEAHEESFSFDGPQVADEPVFESPQPIEQTPSFELPSDEPAAAPFDMGQPEEAEAPFASSFDAPAAAPISSDEPFGSLHVGDHAAGDPGFGASDDVLGIHPPPPPPAPEPQPMASAAPEISFDAAPPVESAFDTQQPATDTLQLDRAAVGEALAGSVITGAASMSAPAEVSASDAASHTTASASFTEVGPQDALFNEPGVEPTQLHVGQPQEILVPVEFHDGQQVKRYRLTLRLEIGS